MDRDQLKQEIRATGLRVTASRLAVLELLRREARPLSHAEVSEALDGQTWDRVTLYRNLIDLADAGILRRLSLGPSWRFEPSSTDHPHFVCVECGNVDCAKDVEMTISKGNRGANVPARPVDVQLHGVCDACA